MTTVASARAWRKKATSFTHLVLASPLDASTETNAQTRVRALADVLKLLIHIGALDTKASTVTVSSTWKMI